jgi:ribonuclease E
MSKKMLIDASHPEETRVVVVNGTRVEELDFESRNKRQIRGNVYLARVTRVEPSLQAAFVEYGGNRHGFLAFSEIHPDYYQIPYEDRVKLIEDEEADNREEAEDEEKAVAKKSRGGRRKSAPSDEDDAATDVEDEDETEEHDDSDDNLSDDDDELDPNLDASDEDVADEADAELAGEQNKVAVKRRKRISRRRYKIQEVIKRGQIMLIQAVKEERGNKGAALTTYLSLAGRYCVLMPNTPRGGGISRKISNGADRKRLKTIVNDLDVPAGIGVIVRTAGSKKTKADIKRDYDYLTRLWEEIKDNTMKSNAPALIHEEGNLVKRSIRDLYNKDIDEILVQGEDAYKSAKAFIKMLMPSHAKNVKHYKESVPLYLRYEVEKQIENSLQSVVQLKSGGYLVIHPTEALVSVDVNSGRSTKERNVERTALKTNLEAAEEVARQMRLRDLAGLIVIDFIDMDENRNNRAVEKRMKDMLTEDRARVQMGRISQFGLMEISRQRRRRSLLEGSTASCEHCDGVGRKRTIESSALAAIRAVEEIGCRGQAKRVKLKVSQDVALYIFNEKRDLLTHVDEEFNLFTELLGDDNLIRPSYAIEIVEKSKNKADPLEAFEKENRKLDHEARTKSKSRKSSKSDDDEDEDDDNNASKHESKDSHDKDGDNDGGRKRRRRRGRRGGRNKNRENETGSESEAESHEAKDAPETDEAGEKPSKSKRGRGRSRNRKALTKDEAKSDVKAEESDVKSEVKADVEAEAPALKRSKGVRKAPARKSTESSEEAETKPKGRKKAAPKAKVTKVKAKSSTARTRPAPSKAEAEAEPKKAPAKRTRKTAAKKTEEPTVSKTTTKSKAPARKAAPARKTVAVKDSDEKPAAKKKAPAKKKTPAKAKAPAKKTATKAKATAKTAAKAKKPAATKESAPKARSRKAPAKKAAPKAPTSDPEPATKAATPAVETPKPAASKPETDTPKKGKKKGGWLSRILK